MYLLPGSESVSTAAPASRTHESVFHLLLRLYSIILDVHSINPHNVSAIFSVLVLTATVITTGRALTTSALDRSKKQ